MNTSTTQTFSIVDDCPLNQETGPVSAGPVFYEPDGLKATRWVRTASAVPPAADEGSDDDGHGHPANDDPEL